ncbi:MAG: hypothetical protein KDI59_05710 [Xanthomonadales bacterium]|nr:hypothetical protein [Xanthomonadales bacterium]
MSEKKATDKESNKKKKPVCGIIMPISSIDGCSAEHWAEVLTIMKEAIGDAEFEPNLVSDADDSGIIQKRIIQNLYKNEIVVCDVSAKNPNVMFELGLRLAFDKPTIIIKDDKTDYSFDTSVIEHLGYPRDLRFSKILKFKETLKSKIQNTFNKSKEDKNYTTFLKHFGEYKVSDLGQKEVSSDKYILTAIDEIKDSIRAINRTRIMENELRHPIRLNMSLNNKAEEIVRQRIEEFKSKYELKNDVDIIVNGKEEQLINYLEDFHDVRDSCKERKVLEDIVHNSLVPF